MCTECQTKQALTPQQIESRIPGALYDIESRIDALRSIATCVLESLPNQKEGVDLAYYVNEAGNLVAAMTDILDLCREDVQRTFEQLKRVD